MNLQFDVDEAEIILLGVRLCIVSWTRRVCRCIVLVLHGGVVADASHECFWVGNLAVECCSREVECRVFCLKAFDHEPLLQL